MSAARLLVVDDSPDLLALLKGLLEQVNGFQVFTAEDGPSALRKFLEVQPDLVILDVWMPEMSGIEVARRIRQSSSVPILFLSAVGTPEVVARGLEAGAEVFLTKPFSPRVLLSKVFELLHWSTHKAIAASYNSNCDKGGILEHGSYPGCGGRCRNPLRRSSYTPDG